MELNTKSKSIQDLRNYTRNPWVFEPNLGQEVSQICYGRVAEVLWPLQVNSYRGSAWLGAFAVLIGDGIILNYK